ncbi:MAG TPA: hypothetical protein DCZ94_07000 [Lentisphaeria bacterium]|nr:MAG: hypothetical protein A2X48_10385 [Lentisphaerae bacterium GWF2_49_21]HBC86682.1 hypothetical protein [Lentisphaeria bacterium]
MKIMIILKLKLVLQLMGLIRRSTNFSLSYLIYMFVVNPPSPRGYGATSVARHVLKVGTCFPCPELVEGSMYHLNSILIKEWDRLPSTGYFDLAQHRSGQESPSLL